MEQIPQHRAALLSRHGIHARWVSQACAGREPVRYVHQDDYYIFIVMEKGTSRYLVDFKECELSEGAMAIIQPGQVHRFISANDASGFVVMVDGSYLGCGGKRALDEFALTGSTLAIDTTCKAELHQLAGMIIRRVDENSPELVRSLAEAFVSVVAERVGEFCREHSVARSRQMEIALAFRSLLKEEVCRNRQPSYYARRLNVSAVYLNEVVRVVTGMSVSTNIRNEILLQAKRLLVHTGLSVKEIAIRLGFDDNAYFSRLFAQTAGVTPTTFRTRNLD